MALPKTSPVENDMTFPPDAVVDHHQIVIVGGGTGGITAAARLLRANKRMDVAIIEPSEKHYYQPMWTLVGGGIATKESTERDEASVIPKGATWIRDFVEKFDPENNRLLTRGGRVIAYGHLILSPGIQLDWGKVKGLKETMGKNGVCSNYSYETVDSTWVALQNLKKGNAIFTFPNTPIKCGGAPQKIMYLVADFLKKNKLEAGTQVIFASAGEKIFGVEKYRLALEKIVARYGIETRFMHNLIEVRGDAKEAVFKNLKTGADEVIPFQMLHVVPPMSGPDFLKDTPLTDAAGFVTVDQGNLRHTKFDNVWALGDVANVPTAKTGAAVRKQAPVLVEHLLASLDGGSASSTYTGYSSCPLVTGYGKLMLAEFDYDSQPMETFPFNQAKERRSMWILKKNVLPTLYWKGMLKGRA